MTYYDTAQLSQDSDFVKRCSACAATEPQAPEDVRADPVTWTFDHAWLLAATPGFGEAYSYAVLNGNPTPGRDPAVITDPQILASVQALLAADEGIR